MVEGPNKKVTHEEMAITIKVMKLEKQLDPLKCEQR